MKLLLLLAVMMSSALSFADSTAIETLLYTGEQSQTEVNLSTEVTRTEYREVPVRRTCYRTVYRQRCHWEPGMCRTICRHGTCRQVCDGGRQICRQVRVQEPYSCTRYERRPYQVHDYDVETNVKFVFNDPAVNSDANENFKVRITGDNRAKLTVNSSANYLIVLDHSERSEQRQGGVKYIDLTYKVSILSAERLKSVLGNGIENVKYKRGMLTFTLGAGFDARYFEQKIKVYRYKRILRDRLVLKKVLSAADMDIIQTESESQVSIDLKKLKEKLPSQVRIVLETSFKMDKKNLLNKNDFKFKRSANWIFR